MDSKKWVKNTMATFGIGLFLFAIVVIIIDPAVHFHKNLKNISYQWNHERYDNDGFLRHFEYQAIITGTSMTENFKTSEFEALFGKKAVKVPFQGAGYKEISDNLERAFSYNDNIEYVVWGLDYDLLLKPYDYSEYFEYPEYLYDKKYSNDIAYILNKDIFVSQLMPDLIRTIKNEKTETMDEYSSWSFETGEEKVLQQYERIKIPLEMERFSDKDCNNVETTITKNILSITKKHPETEFYIFFTPYSIVTFDAYMRSGTFDKQLEAEKIALEMLTAEENIKIYCFFENTDLITNLDNYKDPYHYCDRVNSEILNWMMKDEYLITKDNYISHIDYEREILLTSLLQFGNKIGV